MKLLKSLTLWLILALIGLFLAGIIYVHNTKSLPPGTSYEGELSLADEADFIYDLTYQNENGETQHELHIMNRIEEAILEAEDLIVLDMFLFNSFTDEGQTFPDISGKLTDALIAAKKNHPDIQIAVITDKINTTYGSHKVPEFTSLEQNGIDVIMTNLTELRDPNPLYSSIWRTSLRWLGNDPESGVLPNPLANSAPDVTLRSYFTLLNIKANHRKVLATEKTAIITSANPHNASAHHSNIAVEVKGEIIEEVIQSEQAVIDYSGYDLQLKDIQYNAADSSQSSSQVQLLTEGKINKHVLTSIRHTKKDETIWLGMFYLSDRQVIDELIAAAERGVAIKMILDPNENAFGSEKAGLPNIPVAAELKKLGNEQIDIRWYNTGQEQYHSKMLFIEGNSDSMLIAGSTNFTSRNLDDYNLETNLKILAPSQEKIMKDVSRYFNRLWNNEDGEYTVAYEEKEELPVFKYILYRIQKLFRFTTY
ncbi:phospholipase D family protein [Cytobacillus gottheilii]|uniref:phospholipase D family protein n=1 Tax=Cytobacillus gottheilii TaxID=859144 RepID=UPI0009BB2461|nr:phospholipase D family protein [Cytobacillus gottheilii]